MVSKKASALESFRACEQLCVVNLSLKRWDQPCTILAPTIVPNFLEVDAQMSEAPSPRQEPPNSPPSRAGLYLPGILGAPPPPPSFNGTKTTNLMTSMDQIIRASSPVETSVSLELKGGGMVILSLVLNWSVFHLFLLELSWNLCNSKLDIAIRVRLREM